MVPSPSTWSLWTHSIPEAPFLTGFTLAPISDMLAAGLKQTNMHTVSTSTTGCAARRAFIEQEVLPTIVLAMVTSNSRPIRPPNVSGTGSVARLTHVQVRNGSHVTPIGAMSAAKTTIS